MAHRTKAAAPPSNSLVASATRYTGKAVRIYNGSVAWQQECYRHFAICGEARFAAKFYSHAFSRALLYTGKRGEAGAERDPNSQAAVILNDLFDGKDGQAAMLAAIGLHFTIAGECYLVGRTVQAENEDSDEEVIWEILSVLEIKVNGGKWLIKYDDQSPDIYLADEDVVIRLWVPDAARRTQADSPFRALLPILAEIEWSTRSIFGQMTSRLAGNGLLLLPKGMSFPPPPDIGGRAQKPKNEADGFMMTLAHHMMAPLEDPSLPESKIPVIAMADGDDIAKVQLIQFWSEVDAEAINIRSESIRRFAIGMDLPVESVLGMSSNLGTGGGSSNGVSHWGAWQIEEQTIKMHVEPGLETVVNALTLAYLRPQMQDENGNLPPDPESVLYDISALRLRPDRSKESIELGNLGLLKPEVTVRENGFDPTKDMPDDDEIKLWLLRKIATGSATPDQVQAALKELGVVLDIPEPKADIPNLPEPRQTPEPPSLEDHPTKPRTPAESSALLAACDGLVYRALEKAGNRVLNAGVRGKNRDRSIDPTQFHLSHTEQVDSSVLAGAFTYAGQVLDGFGNAEEITAILEDYCLALFQTKTQHSRRALTNYLQMKGLSLSKPESPMALTVNLNQGDTHTEVHFPEDLVKAPDVSLNPTFEMNPQFDIQTPEMTTNIELKPTFDVAVPDISMNPTFEVHSPEVTTHIDVSPTPIHVEAAAAPSVTVNVDPTPVTVENNIDVKPADVKLPPQKKRETRVIRDDDDMIIGTEEI